MDNVLPKPGPSIVDSLSFLKKGNRCKNCDRREGSLCAVLSCEELDRMDQIMTWEYLRPGQTIFYEGDKLANYYNVTEGVIRVIKLMPDGRRAVLDFLYKGDFLGLNSRGHYAYSAEAVTPVKLCRFPRPKLRAMFEEIPKMEGRLLQMFTDKLIASQALLADLARKSPRERLATFLLSLDEQDVLKNGDGAIALPMTREDISDYLGLTIETISRTFSAFAREGLVKIKNRKDVELLDKRALGAIAEGE